MSVLSELNTLLEKIPLWKRLQTMPSELDELKARVAELEKAIQGGVDDVCPACHKRAFKLTSTVPDPMFGDMGVQVRIYKCSACGHSENKQIS